jgi:VanZ family protein
MFVFIKSIVQRWKLFYFYSFFLILLSILPINSSGAIINHVFIVSIRLDYLLHCLVYIPLVVLLRIDKGVDLLRSPVKAIVWFGVLIIFAAVTEGVQYFLTYRVFNINDLIANSIGVMLGFILIMLVNKTLWHKTKVRLFKY